MENHSRIDAFVDGAFAFAATLLVVSFDSLPANREQLLDALKDIPPFLASFTLLMLMWLTHLRWARYRRLVPGGGNFYSLLLVAVVLIWVFPLRLQHDALFHWISAGWLPSAFQIRSWLDLQTLYVFYGLGFATLGATFVLMYGALRRGIDASISAEQRFEIENTYQHQWILMLVGTLSAALAVSLPLGGRSHWMAVPGMVYTLLGILLPLATWRLRRRLAAP